jgi:hypothetical protein
MLTVLRVFLHASRHSAFTHVVFVPKKQILAKLSIRGGKFCWVLIEATINCNRSVENQFDANSKKNAVALGNFNCARIVLIFSSDLANNKMDQTTRLAIKYTICCKH